MCSPLRETQPFPLVLFGERQRSLHDRIWLVAVADPGQMKIWTLLLWTRASSIAGVFIIDI